MKAYVIVAEQGQYDTYRMWNHTVILISRGSAERMRDELNARSRAEALALADAERRKVEHITGKPHPIPADELVRTRYSRAVPHYEIEEFDASLGDPLPADRRLNSSKDETIGQT